MCGQNRAANQFGNLRDYGVSEPFKAVCSIGNPISHSTHVGFSPPRLPELTPSAMPTDLGSEDCCRPGAFDIPALKSPAFGVGHIATAQPNLFGFARPSPLQVNERSTLAFAELGVGHDPDAVASVACANVGSWYAVPFRIIPDRGQVSENSAQPSTKQCCDVLHDKELWSKFASKPDDLDPEAASRSIQASAKSCERQILAREPSADDIDGNSIGSKSLCGEFSNVMIARHLWPVFRQHAAGKFFNFAKGDRLKPAGAFQPKTETADPAEQVEDTQLFSHLPLLPQQTTNRPNADIGGRRCGEGLPVGRVEHPLHRGSYPPEAGLYVAMNGDNYRTFGLTIVIFSVIAFRFGDRPDKDWLPIFRRATDVLPARIERLAEVLEGGEGHALILDFPVAML